VNELKKTKDEETNAARNLIRMYDWMDELIK